MNKRRIHLSGTGVFHAVMVTLLASASLLPSVRVCAAPAPRNLEGPDKAEVKQLMEELDDIDFVRSITPLKLTGEQIDKLTAEITSARAAYEKKMEDLSASVVGPMADEIHKRHKASLGGAPASKAFDDKVKAMMADFYAKREKVNADNLAAITSACAKIVTPEQQKIAVQLEKDTLVKMGKKLDPAGKDFQYYNLYVLDVFINYDRIVPLLKSMKALQSGT